MGYGDLSNGNQPISNTTNFLEVEYIQSNSATSNTGMTNSLHIEIISVSLECSIKPGQTVY